MICKYCGEELEEGAGCCPTCGAAQEEISAEAAAEKAVAAEEAAAEETAAEETAAEETESAETDAAEEMAEGPKAQKKPVKKSASGWILGCAIAALLALIFIAIFKISAAKMQQAPAEEPAQQTQSDAEGTTVPADSISYTVAADELTDEVLDKVVASCADMQLTNRELGVYYWQQYYNFANQYGQYLSYLMDTTVGFDRQMYDEEMTWQQVFLEGALNQFRGLAAVCKETEDAGFCLSEENQSYIDSIPASLEKTAKSYGFENADAYLHEAFGPGVGMKEYQEFVRMNYLAGSYIDSLVEAVEYSEQDLSDYFDQNSDAFAGYGITKLDKPNVDIRHILIIPAENENGEKTEQAWTEAEQKINEIVAQWEAGEMTEEAFAALAAEHSMDGNASSGGIYTDVHPGQMVAEFNDWCFADGRQTGDYGLVKTKYGWHLIYFCAEGDEIYWHTVAQSKYLSEQAAQIQDSLVEKYEAEINLDNAAIADVLQLQREQ